MWPRKGTEVGIKGGSVSFPFMLLARDFRFHMAWVNSQTLRNAPIKMIDNIDKVALEFVR